MPDSPLYYRSIEELHPHLRTQELSPGERVEACLERIATLNKPLDAFITVLDDDARTLAKAAELEIQAGRWRGPLHGIPIAIKDFYDTAGVKTTAAFEPFRNRIPKRDAVSVAALKAAGAIVIGKTNMHQLGMGTTGLDSYFGAVRNPWNADYIPGGSSSGSAAAVASGMCYATLDTDAIGSCRLPAACCGVVGFKGTYGLISSKGILEGEPADEAILWLSHPGLTTRSVQDTAVVLNVLAHPSFKGERDYRRDAATNDRVAVGVANNFKADADVSSAFSTAVESITAFASEVVSVAAPFEMPPFGDLHAIEDDRATISDKAFKNIDLLVLPTTTASVPSVKDAGKNAQALAPANTMFANYYGLPAVSVPCGFDRHGLPIGVQIVGKPKSESSVLRLARRYEQAAGLRARFPIS